MKKYFNPLWFLIGIFIGTFICLMLKSSQTLDLEDGDYKVHNGNLYRGLQIEVKHPPTDGGLIQAVADTRQHYLIIDREGRVVDGGYHVP